MPLTPKQREIRSTRSGGSDVATLLDENAFETLLELYAEKTCIDAPQDAEQTERQFEGNLMEETCARWYEQGALTEKGLTVALPMQWKPGTATEGTLLHARYPDILCATPDRIVVPQMASPIRLWDAEDASGVVECKYVGPTMSKEWGDPETDDVPAMYALQVITERMVVESILGREVDVALVAFIHGKGFGLFDVPRNEDLEGVILEAARYFKERHLDPRVPPEPSGRLDSLQRAVKVLYRESRGRKLVAIPHVEALMDEHRQNSLLAKQYQAVSDRLKIQLQIIMGEAECLESPELGKILWKNEKPRVELDVTALRAAYAEICDDFMVEKPPRRPFKPYYKEEIA